MHVLKHEQNPETHIFVSFQRSVSMCITGRARETYEHLRNQFKKREQLFSYTNRARQKEMQQEVTAHIS